MNLAYDCYSKILVLKMDGRKEAVASVKWLH